MVDVSLRITNGRVKYRSNGSFETGHKKKHWFIQALLYKVSECVSDGASDGVFNGPSEGA